MPLRASSHPPGEPQFPQLFCPCMVQLLVGIISLKRVRGPNPGRSHGSADTLPLHHSANTSFGIWCILYWRFYGRLTIWTLEDVEVISQVHFFKLTILQIDIMSMSWETAFKWMPHDFTYEKSTLIWVMAWWHYLNKCWPRSISLHYMA